MYGILMSEQRAYNVTWFYCCSVAIFYVTL